MSSFYPQPVRRQTSVPPPDLSELWDDLVTGVWVKADHDTHLEPVVRHPSAIAVEPALPRPRRNWAVLFLVFAAAVGGSMIALAVHIHLKQQQPQPVAVFEATPDEESDERELLSRVYLTAGESSRARHWRSAGYRDLWQASEWWHPLADEVFLPGNGLRKFGAKRPGRRPSECGRGHCGVDLGHFGLPVRAARAGTVAKVQRHSTRKEGRYVRIVHDDGFVTYYMHLHRIRSDLQKGMRVDGGEVIGVVGRTGIRRSPPHLHFALAYLEGRKKVFIDPEPLLRRSVSVEDQAAF